MLPSENILFISHHFPPIGGAGVQRTLKFVKYLPEFGWRPVVITGPGEHFERWSCQDSSLLGDVPADTEIYRADYSTKMARSKPAAYEKQRFLAMFRAGVAAAQGRSIRLILVSMSPFQDATIASRLSVHLGIPWVADLRDPWALDEFQVHRSAAHRLVARRRMYSSLHSAALIIMNTPEAANRFKTAFPSIPAQRVIHITNGFDAADFPDAPREIRNSRFTIVHSGFFHTRSALHQRSHHIQYRILGRLPTGVNIMGRTPYYFTQGLERWFRDSPSVKNSVQVIFIGNTTREDKELVERSTACDCFRFIDYLPHSESVRSICDADLLFLPLHGLRNGSRATIVPGKTYEYMATGVPILATLPEGDARDFLVNAGTGLVCQPDDVPSIARMLNQQHDNWIRKIPAASPNKNFVDSFERKELSKQLAAQLELVTAHRR
jgi:glycosyltransferase involved in cell wall biosynthesis